MTSRPAGTGLAKYRNVVVEATEEAIYNSLFQATTVTGNGRTVEAIPLDKVRAVLKKYGRGGN